MRARPELTFAKLLLASRWAMAPLALGLVVALVLELAEFYRELVRAVLGFSGMAGSEVTLGVLKLIDIALIANLVLMIIGAAVGVFIAPAGDADIRREAGIIDFGQLKLRGFAYVSAIAAIDLLETFVNIDAVKKEDVLCQIAILLAIVVSGVLLALMDRVAERR